MKAACLLTVLWLLAGCTSLPHNAGRIPTWSATQTDDSRLGRTMVPLVAEHAGLSGLFPLTRGTDALAARCALADAAERTLDVQYYIWHADDTGRRLAGRLMAAADRGVRVRVLLDDFGSTAKDEGLLVIDGHPNIEVRLFNPLALREARVLGVLSDFSRATRRMHNKSFTADNQITVVGGRNVGDEYFEADAALDFADLDVLAVGPVVPEVSASFDLFWNSPASFPITTLSRETDLPPPLRPELCEPFDLNRVRFEWGHARIVSDHPDKVAMFSTAPTHQLLPHLRPVAERAQREVFIVSPYLIPGRKGVEFVRSLRRRGVRVVMLTNSLAATDTVPAHAGYARYRRELLRLGVELYELKPTAPLRRHGTSNASLHAKSFVFDRQALFVGSLNLDPRSARLNTEIGVVFESPALAGTLVATLEQKLSRIAWRVEAVAGPEGRVRLHWIAEDGRRTCIEPGTTVWERFKVAVMGWLPIESQL